MKREIDHIESDWEALLWAVDYVQGQYNAFYQVEAKAVINMDSL